jgi:starch phosphorylase
MTIADFRSYIDTQKRVEDAYRDQDHWTRMSILNCANSGKFSADRTIREYNQDIWKLTPQPVKHHHSKHHDKKSS